MEQLTANLKIGMLAEFARLGMKMKAKFQRVIIMHFFLASRDPL